ncbi:protein of unknown function [Xenorhabdus poinarii G6]|uniref:Uncharacterized protein n=1 Tax=Xenorhabdus poinarii G6 TaxID=1354304 RepID=A0A068R411_9GAMM|nr:protein of unknown function [Xenorhabdus poinarii G6]
MPLFPIFVFHCFFIIIIYSFSYVCYILDYYKNIFIHDGFYIYL